jgi:hypothetical protein
VPDAVVSVCDKQGSEVLRGKTDARGEIRDIAVLTRRYCQQTKDPNRIITKDYRSPFRVNIIVGSVSISREITAARAEPSVSTLPPAAVRDAGLNNPFE